jgi:predicted deacylase
LQNLLYYGVEKETIMGISIRTFADKLFSEYDSFRVPSFKTRRFTSEEYHAILDAIVASSSGKITVRPAGFSFEKRPIRLLSVGTGSTSVLLWSQMHGDESTATMATADILQYLAKTPNEEATRVMMSRLSIHFLPMLNPDGAARFQRRTAQNIDMNRDALALATPEARILKELQHELRPHFGYNLHDQELSTVGTSKQLSALALLAPAYDQEKSDNEVRRRAKSLTATFAGIVLPFVPGGLTRYDDSFEPRAFGDNMQRWGTSTILVESGHATADAEKFSIRKLNAVGILASLYGIATGEYTSSNISEYEQLPFNGKKAYDLIIRNIRIKDAGGSATPADVAISYQVDTHTEPVPVLADLGDLHTYFGLREIDGRGIPVSQDLLMLGKPFTWEEFVSLAP